MASVNSGDGLRLKTGLAEGLKGGVIMDVTNVEPAAIAEKAGAVAVMALERVPAQIRAEGGVARIASPKKIRGIMDAVSNPVVAKCRIGHFAEAQILDRRMNSCVNAIGCLVPMCAGGGAGSTGVDNARLIRAAQQGDAASFERLVHQYDRAVLRVAVHLTGSTEDGQDIYQEAFLRAYMKLPRFRFECSFYTWIYRIVTNLCLDHLRKKRLHHRSSTTVPSGDGQELDVSHQVPDERAIASPERTFTVRVLGEHIARALNTLSPRERMVFELKHYQSMQLKTVAGILNTTEGTAKNTLFRATRKLRALLAGVR